MATPPENYTRTHIRWSDPEDGWMEFDAVLRQTIDHDGEVTEHPVDTGASIADHYRSITVPVVLETIISNSPLELPLTHTGGAQEIQRRDYVELPTPIFPGAPTTVGGFSISSKTRVGITTLDFTSAGSISNRDPGLDRINLMYEELRNIQSEARLLTLSLDTIKGPDAGGAYDSMLLKRFSFDRDASNGNSVSVTLEFKKIALAIVLNEDLSSQLPARKRSNRPKDAGKQNSDEKTDDKPAEERSRSAFSRLVSS